MTNDQLLKILNRILITVEAGVIITGAALMIVLHAFAVLFIALMSIAWRR